MMPNGAILLTQKERHWQAYIEFFSESHSSESELTIVALLAFHCTHQRDSRLLLSIDSQTQRWTCLRNRKSIIKIVKHEWTLTRLYSASRVVRLFYQRIGLKSFEKYWNVSIRALRNSGLLWIRNERSNILQQKRRWIVWHDYGFGWNMRACWKPDTKQNAGMSADVRIVSNLRPQLDNRFMSDRHIVADLRDEVLFGRTAQNLYLLEEHVVLLS